MEALITAVKLRRQYRSGRARRCDDEIQFVVSEEQLVIFDKIQSVGSEHIPKGILSLSNQLGAYYKHTFHRVYGMGVALCFGCLSLCYINENNKQYQ